MAKVSTRKWFDNCGGWVPQFDLGVLRAGIEAGRLNEQDEYGMAALHLAVASDWLEGVEELLRAGADTERRYFRTGETALHTAVQEANRPLVKALLAGGANPDAANYWGFTPRQERPRWFAGVRRRKTEWPEFRIQNAEHLADHYHPRFKIPDREERETLKPGQAVDLYVYGPKSDTKQDTVKVRISRRSGRRPQVRYTGVVETPLEQTHLPAGTTELEFGPEHVATVYVPRGSRPRTRRKSP
jgi:hypothetical protein